MATIADLVIKLRADTGVAERDISSFGAKVGRGIRKSFVPAVAALGALGVAAKVGFGEFVDAEKVTAQTNAVLKSTGGIANVTAGQIDDMASALLNKSGVDDEAIKSGANLLLTFTNIRNEAGKGNDIFTQSTGLMLDMSTALGTDMKSSAVLLGKALNDPTRGLTALQRVGVAFTDDQKKQIKTLVESGNTMRAQKIVLGELNREFGGSAAAAGKTFAGQLSLVKEQAKNFAAELIAAALPALRMVVSMLGRATSFMQAHSTATKAVIGVIAVLAGGIVAVNAAMKAYAAGAAIVRAASAAWTAAQWLLNAALTANPIGIVIMALVALGAALVVLWTKSETFRRIVTAAWNAIKATTVTVWNFIKDFFAKWWPLVLAIMTGGVGLVVVMLVKHWDDVKAKTLAAWNAIKDFLAKWWPLLLTVMTGGIGLVVALVITKWDAIKSATSRAWNAVRDAIVGAVNTARNAVSTVFKALAGIVKGAVGAVRGAVSALVGTFHPVIDVLHRIVSVAGSAADAIGRVVDAAGKVGGAVGKVAGLAGKIPGFASGVSNFAGGLAVVGERGPELVNLPRGSDVFSNEQSRKMAGGGVTIQGDLVVREELDIERIGAMITRRLSVVS